MSLRSSYPRAPRSEADESGVWRAEARPGHVPRVAIVTEYYYPHLGGICEHVHFFAREARRKGWHVDIITSNMRGASPEPHVIRLGRSVVLYANGSLGRITAGWRLRQQVREALRRGRYDLVHAHTPLAPTLPLLAVDEAECPVVGTFHTQFGRQVGYELGHDYFQRRLDRLAAAVAVSPTAAASVDRYFETEWKIIPNGVDVEMFRPEAPRPSGMVDGVPTILFLGRLDPRNGLGTLIDAFRRVRGPRRPARLVVAGDGPLRPYYERRAGGDPDIAFVGKVFEERAGYYAHCDVYACPSTKASFGITLLEAMACGTPIVCSDAEGFRDVVANGREALIVPMREPDALADSLALVLEDDALRARLGAEGRQRAMQYAWPRVADQILDLYAQVLGLKAAA